MHDSNNMGPFGNPDGSRAGIENIIDGFVNFGSAALWGGLALQSGDRTARVIVGRKGSGKTVYLRRLQADATREGSMYADDIQQEIPQTEAIIRFCQTFSPDLLTEKWIAAWQRAILSSVVSHLLCQPQLREKISDRVADQLTDGFTPILPTFRTPVSAYNQMARLLEMNRSYNSLNAYLSHELWGQLEWLVGETIRDLPPMCFYIDAVDEAFERAPMYWLRCQLGLFLAVMHLLRDSRLGARLHVFICIRDIVLSSVLRSEHRTRYYDEPHIRVLRWDEPAIAYFLEQKVAKLAADHFMGDVQRHGSTVETWLGGADVRNTSRRIEEPVRQYLLRHTRLLPRDVITLGNRLCKAVAQQKHAPRGKTWDQSLREVVRDAARVFGEEQLKICANQLTSDMLPAGSANRGYSDAYTGNAEYIGTLKDDIKSIIARVGRDHFRRSDLDDARKHAASLFGTNSDAFSVLWQNGVLGYVEKKKRVRRTVFFTEDRIDEFRLPPDKEEYVFHSCILDCVPIRAVGKHPVIVAGGAQ